MTYGLSEKNWKFILDQVVTRLKNEGAQVFVFGSRASGNNQEFSDLDIGYVSTSPINNSLIVKIKDELEDSDLPIKVDLVNVDDIPESFMSSVTRTRVNL